MKNEKAYLKKLMYNEFDEAETYIKGKVKTTKVNKPKKIKNNKWDETEH